jgi:hypothetical protein
MVLTGSYNANYGRRQLWIYAGSFSVLLIGLPVYALIMWPGRESLGTAVLGVACWLIISYLFLFLLPWRVELTADEFRWHAVLRTGAVPLSRVRSIRRGDRSRVYFKIDGVGGSCLHRYALNPQFDSDRPAVHAVVQAHQMAHRPDIDSSALGG